ncbi:MAG: M24 family metallopeptidase [Nitrososphaerales archaeon]|nr:M24 family metallopeptidase [Nitrososphaerales archaeon]
MFKERRASLLRGARRLGCDMVASATPQNLFYTTGFWGDGTVIIDHDGTTLFTSPLEGGRARKHAKDCDVVTSGMGKSLKDMVIEYVVHKGKVCFDDVEMDLQFAIKKELKEKVVFDPDLFYSVRRVKDEEEINNIAQAGRITDKLYDYASSLIRPKVRERELAAELLSRTITSGCDIPSYASTQNSIIVASGPNSAFPHADLTDRRLSHGDVVTIDLVIRFNGYVVDTTRTFAVGKVNNEVKRVYETVKSAQEEGTRLVKPDTVAGEVDKKVRDIINEKRYGKFFIHGTGHGVGLDVHEPPRLRMNGKEVLQKNDVVTVEPGVYMPNKFGIRIEDTILVSKRAKPFTKFPKELLIL